MSIRKLAVCSAGIACALVISSAGANDKPTLNPVVPGQLYPAPSMAGTKDSDGCTNPPQLMCGEVEQGFLSTECINTNTLGTDVYFDVYRFTLNSNQRVIINQSAQFSTADFGEDQLDSVLLLAQDDNADGLPFNEPIIGVNDDSGWPTFSARNSTIDMELPAGDYSVVATTFGEFQTGPYALSLHCPPGPNQNIQVDHTGVWETVTQNGSGFPVHILPNNSAIGYWFTYRDGGSPQNDTSFWAVMPGTVNGPFIDFDIVDLSGPGFGASYNPDDLAARFFGQGRLQVFGCRSGMFEFFSDVPADFPSYAMSVNKFAMVPGLDCN